MNKGSKYFQRTCWQGPGIAGRTADTRIHRTYLDLKTEIHNYNPVAFV